MRDYLAELTSRGEVLVVEREVDPSFELAAVTAAAQKQSDQAVLFRRVKGSNMPVATNVYGSRSRLCRMIGADDRNFCRRWTELTNGAGNGSQVTQRAAEATDMVPGKLGDLPQIHYFERDAGPYVTAGVFLAKDPETGVPNLSFHRAMFVDDGEMRIRLGDTHDLTGYFAKAETRNQPLEVAMMIGPPPAVFLGAAASLPPDGDELSVSAAVAGGPIAMRNGRATSLEIPAEAEIVVEGRLLPNVRRPEGPFGEFMGYYVPEGDNVVFQVDDVSWREGATFHSLLCGSPEDMRTLEVSIATRIYRHLAAQLPGIIDVSCHPTLLNTVVKIDKQYEGHPRHVIMTAFGAHPDYSKACLVVDDDVDIYDLNDVVWAYLTRGRADTRAFIVEDVPGFYRDPHKDHWGRLGIDATMPLGREDEFERKRIPGADDIDLKDYLA